MEDQLRPKRYGESGRKNCVRSFSFSSFPDDQLSSMSHDFSIGFSAFTVQLVRSILFLFSTPHHLKFLFELTSPSFRSSQASARTASGNLDLPEPTSNYSDVLYSVYVNNQTSSSLEWIIPYNASSSCSQRSGISCYNLRHLFQFPATWLGQWNTFRLALPYNASFVLSVLRLLPLNDGLILAASCIYSGGDVNFRNYSGDVMYDSMRLELSQWCSSIRFSVLGLY